MTTKGEILEVPLSDLQPDPKNARKTFHAIAELAASIREDGLLQNLVIREAKYGDGDRPYTIVAGERRLRAISQNTAAADADPSDVHIRCLLIDDAFEWVHLTENLLRDDLSPWDLGMRFRELQDAGLTQAQIAARLNMGQGRVSVCYQIALYLAPKTINRLNSLAGGSGAKLTIGQLKQLAQLHNLDTGAPDAKAQMERLEKLVLKGPARRGRPPNDGKAKPTRAKTKVYNRYQQLRRGVNVPPYAMPFVHAIVRFLDGSTKEPRWPEEDEL